MAPLESAIDRMEEKIQSRTEEILDRINGQVMSLPSLDEADMTVSIQIFDLEKSQQQANAKKQEELRTGSLPSPSPGQKVKLKHDAKALANPYSSRNRQVLHDNHGIQLPLLVDHKLQAPEGQVYKGSTVEKLATLPSKHDPQNVPPPIKEEDAKKGILSLTQRRLIPPTAELQFNPSPLQHQLVSMHPAEEKRNSIVPSPPKTYSTAVVPVRKVEESTPSGRRTTSSNKNRRTTPVAVKNVELGIHQPMPPPTTPASGDFKEKGHRIAIQNGKMREAAPEFHAFKQAYCLNWGPIATLLKQVCKMLSNYNVPIAFLQGDKAAELAFEIELEGDLTITQLLSIIANREDVESVIKQPGRTFKASDVGIHKAASRIQATWKMYVQRKSYLEYRRKKWAAGVIAISWIMSVKMSKVRRQLKATRLEQVASFKRRLQDLKKRWSSVKESRRVVIHMNSYGYNDYVRKSTTKLNIRQNLQMARLCDLRDDNVDVIYISSVAISDEMIQYYSKLMGLKPAIESSNVDDQRDISERFTIITPDAINSFPAHNMCLASLLKYSPRTLNRIKSIIKGREAYMFTGIPQVDDLAVADVLNIPMICSEPNISTSYSSKSGSRRILVASEVPIPPGEFDIFKTQHLFESLAQLIIDNLQVSRWLIKIDDEMEGRGIAYIDIDKHLQCYDWIVREAARYGDKWNKKWAQEAALIKIQTELPSVIQQFAVPACRDIYPTWEEFEKAFLSRGGGAEASPPSESVTAITADMLIEPDGTIQLMSVGDQVHAENPFQCWGVSVPQSSVEPQQLNDILQKVAETCRSRHIIGPISIDLVTFIHPKTMEQLVWAVNVNMKYSDTLAMFNMLLFSTNAKFDTVNHVLECTPPPPDPKKRRDVKLQTETNNSRYAVLSTRLQHSNLTVVHYSVFFQMCRAHGIGYDVREKQGTIFTLVDSFSRDRLGMLTVSDTLQAALASFARNLSVIHQEISAPNMQGESNFRAVIDDIEAILGTTVENADEENVENLK